MDIQYLKVSIEVGMAGLRMGRKFSFVAMHVVDAFHPCLYNFLMIQCTSVVISQNRLIHWITYT